MKKKLNVNKTTWLMTVFLGICLFGVSSSAQAFILISDFDDGTLQGWTKEPVFNGTLFVDPAGGNPDGFMVATDSVGAGGPLLAHAPGVLSGDLSLYDGLQWDEFVYNHGTATTIGTSIRLKGFDGTIYESSTALGPLASWHTKLVSFSDSSNWTLRSGSAPFFDVVNNVDNLFLAMDTSILANGNRESGIDNIGLLNKTETNAIPEPSTMALVGMGVAGFYLKRRRLAV